MPYKNKTKIYIPGTYYHLYARGINKMVMYKSPLDYKYFLFLLEKYLTPNFIEKRQTKWGTLLISTNSVAKEIELEAFAIMPNHFHLLCKNIKKYGITNLMRRILALYSMYYNQKYKRRGPLIEGSYRAINIKSEHQLIQTSRYIHLNPYKAKLVQHAIEYPHTSLKYYLTGEFPKWVKRGYLIDTTTDHRRIERYSSGQSSNGLGLEGPGPDRDRL